MVEITAAQVKELRELTGAGMMECKKALSATNGNIEAAIKVMREAGITKAAKKSGRITAEGLIVIKVETNNRSAILLEVNCETDFVSRDDNFKSFVETLSSIALHTKTTDISSLSNLPYSGSTTVEQARQELISKLGENIQIRRVARLEAAGRIGSYIHSGRIGALVALSVDNAELAKDLAMHIAASDPLTIYSKDVPADLIAKEREIFIAQSASSGKPDKVIEQMVSGRINKFINEVSLLGQPFVKDPSKTVASLLDAAQAEVTGFVRFEVGQGIEKPVEDFAQAVMAQISGET